MKKSVPKRRDPLVERWREIIAILAAAAAMYVAPAPAAPVGCPEGMEKGADTSGHCCWPMQAWNGARCVGTPSCPSPLVVSGESCETPACQEGQERMSDGLNCCWPQQAWSSSRGECIGAPVCPAGFEARSAGCLSPAELARIEEEERRTGIEWVRIPGGTFQMGSTSGEDDEQPVHTVRVSSFELMKTEVTVGQYRQCVKAGVCRTPKECSWSCNWSQSGREDHPMNCVTWLDAQRFAAWAEGRLPSEAEWEYAARSGGQPWKYPWGNEDATCSRAHKVGCGQDGTRSVCSKPTGNSTHGVCDLSGNVFEWVKDHYHDSYLGAPGDGTAWDIPLPTVYGYGVPSDFRVYRGGSWNRIGSTSRGVSDRYAYGLSLCENGVGFRLARSVL